MEWEKPVVNGIWQENEAGPRGRMTPAECRGCKIRDERGARQAGAKGSSVR
jgi:hypothetical protein